MHLRWNLEKKESKCLQNILEGVVALNLTLAALFVTTLYEADGRARQGKGGFFGTAALLYILWDFTVSDLAQIGPRLGRD